MSLCAESRDEMHAQDLDSLNCAAHAASQEFENNCRVSGVLLTPRIFGPARPGALRECFFAHWPIQPARVPLIQTAVQSQSQRSVALSAVCWANFEKISFQGHVVRYLNPQESLERAQVSR